MSRDKIDTQRSLNNDLVNSVKVYCLDLISKGRCSIMQFHNVNHTNEVVSNALFIGNHLNLDFESLELLQLAAYFHDVGNVLTSKDHERLSLNIAYNFLKDRNYDEEKIYKVQAMILATNIPQSPQNLLEEVLCDADLGHLGKKGFRRKNKKLREEWKEFLGLEFTDTEWYQLNMNFLKNHKYHTKFAREFYKEQKDKNIKRFKNKFNKD